MVAEPVERKLAAILSADVAEYSRLMAEDETETVSRLTAYRTQITHLVGEHRGRVVDFPGDNFLAEFPTATGAVEAAAEIQRVLGNTIAWCSSRVQLSSCRRRPSTRRL